MNTKLLLILFMVAMAAQAYPQCSYDTLAVSDLMDSLATNFPSICKKEVIGTISYGSTGCVIPGETNIAAGGKFFVHWDQNGSNADRQLKPWLDPTNTGVMTLDGKNSGTVGMADEIEKAIRVSIYPNPATDIITIRMDAKLPGSVYTITDFTGKTIIQVKPEQQSACVDIQKLAPGIYFVTYSKSNMGKEAVKFIKH
jgi:hypothetical protein